VTLSILYVILMVAANVFATLWMVPLPFGLAVPAGVFFFAPLFTLRDRIQVDRGLRWVYALIVVTALASWLTGWAAGSALLARISLASVAAFLVSELLDTFVFTALKRSFVTRVLVSNLISALFDSAIFITLAFGFLPHLILGQWIVKVLISAAVIPFVKPRAAIGKLLS
jgi:queuosine precursor transporter